MPITDNGDTAKAHQNITRMFTVSNSQRTVDGMKEKDKG